MTNKPKMDAKDAGYEAHDRAGETSGVPQSYGAPINAPGDILEKERKENRRVVEVQRKILETGGLDWADLASVDLNSENAEDRAAARQTLNMQNVSKGVVDHGAREMIYDAYMEPNSNNARILEQNVYQPVPQTGTWKINKYRKKTKSGRGVTVFEVADTLTGMVVGSPFRLHEVAEKIVLVLNATNNPNDSRIQFLEHAYTKHVDLMRQRNRAKRNGDGKKLSIIESKLQVVNARLGIR